MTSAAALASTSTFACFPISETSPGLFHDEDERVYVQSESSDAPVDAQGHPSVSRSDSSPRILKWLPGESNTSTSSISKTLSPNTQAKKGFGTWLSPKKGRRGGAASRSLPLPDLADEGTDASSSGLDEGLSLVPPSFRDTRKLSNASSLGSATEASTSLPSPLLPPFASSPSQSLHSVRRRLSSAAQASADYGSVRADPELSAVAAPAMRLSGLFGPIGDSRLGTSQLGYNADQTTVARLELQRSIRKLDNALARLRQRQTVLSAPSACGADETFEDFTATHTPVSPASNVQIEQGHLSPPASSTPTRSRLFRSLGRAPSSSSRRESPHLASTSTPDSPSNSRSWASALHAILSPSPTLPRMFPSPYLRTDSPSPMVDQLESAQIGINNLVDQVRRAQNDILGTIQSFCELSGAPVSQSPSLKEPVFFLSQALVSGLELPSAGHTAKSFGLLKQASETLLQSFAHVLDRQGPVACKPPDAGMSRAHILLQSYGDKLETSASYDVFASEGEAGPAGDSMQQRAQTFICRYQSFASELRNYHSAARQERRQHRVERRTARLQKASTLYGKQNGHAAADSHQSLSSTNIALLSSQELFEHTLHRALREGLYTQDEVEAYEPRVILTLPRLAIAFGVRESSFTCRQPEQQSPVQTGSSQVLLEVFLPRMCRALPLSAVNTTKAMSCGDFERMAKRLCIDDAHVSLQGRDGEKTALMDDVFRAISTLADGSGVPNKGRHTKLMRKVLRSYLAVSEGRPEDDDEDECTIARAFLAVAGL